MLSLLPLLIVALVMIEASIVRPEVRAGEAKCGACGWSMVKLN